MTSRYEAREAESDRPRPSWGWNAAGWLLGILGGIAAFLGMFILFAGDEHYVGLGGDLSWSVGEISDAWMYGLLFGGGLALLIAFGLIVTGRNRAGETQAHASDLSELLWHAGIFVVVNAFIWAQDIAIGGGVEYAYWVTIPWGIGLAVHAVVFYWSRREGERKHLGEPQPH